MRRIRLTQGQFAIVDDKDYAALAKFAWRALRKNHTFYAHRDGPRRDDGSRPMIYMHRVVARTPDGARTDHRNGNGLDNRRRNLRVATARQNQQNRTHKRAGCSSRYRGVFWHKGHEWWQAAIADGPTRANGKARSRYLGHFDTELEAAFAYDEAARESFGAFASLNFPLKERSR